MIRSFAVLAAALLVTGCATGATVRHDGGVHFHADLGVVGSRSAANQFGESLKYSGGGAAFAVAAGGSVAPNLILGGELWMSTVSDATETYDGIDGSWSEELPDLQYNVVGIGPRLTYYFMPVNMYVSATPSFTRMTLSHPELRDYSTELGFGLRGSVGKEWAVSPNWGMGLAGVLQFSSNDGEDDGRDWSTFGGGVVFSASFN